MQTDDSYGKQAYRSDAIPTQPDQENKFHLGFVARAVSKRLPWGAPDDVIPFALFELDRFWCENPISEINQETARRFDHKKIRYVKPGFIFTMFRIIYLFGITGCLIGIPFLFSLFLYLHYSPDFSVMYETFKRLWIIYGLVPIISFLSLVFSACMNKLFPSIKDIEGRGRILWELDRKTGIVSVWVRDKKRSRLGKVVHKVVSAPFYEFDAWVDTRGDQVGPRYSLILLHRYKKIRVNVGVMIERERSPYQSYALWDFVQTYMDVLSPLPDIPPLEPYRHLDPTTSEFDRSLCRPKDYWQSLGKKHLHEEKATHWAAARRLVPTVRYNIMADKVQYYYKQGS